MKIGILGGTFNPVHNGHLMIAEYAYRQFQLDEIWFLPNGNPPHKDNPNIQKDTCDRVRMVELAIENIPYFRICTYETSREELSYSYKTMEYFTKAYPKDKFYFILGADSLFAIETWKHVDRLIQTVTILAAYRDDADTPQEMNRQIDYLNKKYKGDIRLLRTPLVPISSHEIRSQIELGSFSQLPLPDKVVQYIREQQLYRGEDNDGNIEKIAKTNETMFG